MSFHGRVWMRYTKQITDLLLLALSQRRQTHCMGNSFIVNARNYTILSNDVAFCSCLFTADIRKTAFPSKDLFVVQKPRSRGKEWRLCESSGKCARCKPSNKQCRPSHHDVSTAKPAAVEQALVPTVHTYAQSWRRAKAAAMSEE
jgi:hypothetical protein